MSRFNTGNPIDSNDPRDLSDNARNLDQAINSDSSTWTDRLGNERKTFKAAENAAEAAEQAADEAVQTLIPQQVQRAEDRADEAVDTEIPAEVQRATEAADGTEQVLQGAQDALDAAEIDWEERFQAGQDDKQDRFNTFIASSGYEFVGDYEGGIELTEYNQVVRDTNGEFWRVSGSQSLPYTTDGSGLPEGGALAPLGDAVLRQELDGDVANGQGARLVRGAVIYVDTVDGLEALDTSGLASGQSATVSTTGRAGNFTWMSGDRSAEVDNDPEHGIWVAPGSDSTGASGVWMRQYNMWQGIRPEWFGAVSDGASESTTAILAARDYINLMGGGTLLFGPGKYITKGVKLGSNTSVIGAGIHATEVMLADDSHVGIPNNRNHLFYMGDLENDPEEVHEGFSVSNMTLNGNSDNNSAFGASALLHAYRTSDIRFYNLTLKEAPGRGVDIYNMGEVHNPRNHVNINNVLVSGSKREGAYIRHGVRHVSVNGLEIYDCAKESGPANIDRLSGTSASLVIDHSEGNYSNVKVHNCHGHGIWVRNVTSINMTNITSTSNAGHGMYLDRFVSSSGASWISHGNSQAQSNEYSDIFFTSTDTNYGRTKDLTVSGVSVGNGRVYFFDQEDKETRTRFGIEFHDTEEEDAVYENVTLTGVAYANNEFYGLGPSNLWGNIKLPRNRDTIYIGDDSRQRLISERKPIQRWGFEDSVYQEWSQTNGLQSIDSTSAVTLSRNSEATAIGPNKRLTYGVDEPRLEYDRVARRQFVGLLQEKRSVNLITESLSPTGDREISVDNVEYTISFEGPPSASITLSGAHSAVVSGLPGKKTSTYTFTPSSGTLNLEFDGDVSVAQLEEGGAATSRIITSGSQKTRSFDYAESVIGDGFNKFDGSLIFDFTLHELNVNRGVLDFENGFRIQCSGVGPGGLSYVFTKDGEGTLFSIPVRFGLNTRTRVAVKWRRTSGGMTRISVAINGRLYVAGDEVSTDVIQNDPGDRFGLFNRLDATNGESGWLHDLRIYAYAPSDWELITMSRID